MKKFLLILLSALIMAPATTFAGNVPATAKTETAFNKPKPGKLKAKKMKNLKKAAKWNGKRSGGDLTRFNCGRK